MEILTPPQIPNMAPGGVTASNNSVNTKNTATIGQIPEQVVTSATKVEGGNISEDDASKDGSDERRDRRIQEVSALNSSNISAVVSFDAETSQIFVDIKNNENGEVISRFPSEELRSFFEDNQANITVDGPISVTV